MPSIEDSIISFLQEGDTKDLFDFAPIQKGKKSEQVIDGINLGDLDIYEEIVKIGSFEPKIKYSKDGQYFNIDDILNPNFHLIEWRGGAWRPVPVNQSERDANTINDMDPDIRAAFDSHVQNYNNSQLGRDYKSDASWLSSESRLIPESLNIEVMPAKFVGWLEDNPELFQDVILAADETGVDPNALYMIYMQEGGAFPSTLKKHYLKSPGGGTVNEIPMYRGDFYINTFNDIGLDSFLADQDLALSREYLSEKVETKGEIWTVSNEENFTAPQSHITMKDALRATGATMRLNVDYLKKSSWHDLDGDPDTPDEKVMGFEELGIDFDSMSDNQKIFWTYASINAGHKDAKLLLNEYGETPWDNFNVKNPWSSINVESGSSLMKWMNNVGRVLEGYKLLKPFDAFNLMGR